jgi:peroxiredoxin
LAENPAVLAATLETAWLAVSLPMRIDLLPDRNDRRDKPVAATQSLKKTLADFQAKRAETMAPDKLKVNVDQRRLLVETSNRQAFVKAGDKIAAFELTEVGGETLTRDTLLKKGPVVLIFFRFAGCPACNIALPYYKVHLAPELAKLGATLIGISPQVPERLVEIKDRHRIDFLIASDIGNTLGRSLGILYAFDEPSRQSSIASGHPIGEVTGTGTWELPMPAIVVIDQGGIVRFADVSPDWLVRTEAGDVIDAVRGLTAQAAA